MAPDELWEGIATRTQQTHGALQVLKCRRLWVGMLWDKAPGCVPGLANGMQRGEGPCTSSGTAWADDQRDRGSCAGLGGEGAAGAALGYPVEVGSSQLGLPQSEGLVCQLSEMPG